jgi:RNA polymerase sigma-70 factor, ECF subfamily
MAPAARQALVPDPCPDAARLARDREWVARIRTGDVAAFESMWRAYKNDIGAFVMSYVRSRAAAEEVVQDLFLRIWVQRHLWEVPGPFHTYLFSAARNRAINYLRHERVEAAFRERVACGGGDGVAAEARAADADEEAVTHALAADIGRSVAALPERCQEVFRLVRFHHLSYAEVATVLGISVKTVEVHMGRALTALRARLEVWRE